MTSRRPVRAKHAASPQRKPGLTRQLQHDDLYTYLAKTLSAQLAAMQQDLIECEQVRVRTLTDIKHIRRQIANLRRKAKS